MPGMIANLRPFDHARATLAGIKSGQTRRERAALKARLKLADHVQRIAEPDERLILIAEQLSRTRRALNERQDVCPACGRSGLDGKDRAALIRALCSLLDQQRIARGEPLPGSRKPPPERRQADHQPVTYTLPCGPKPPAEPPNTPTCSVSPNMEATSPQVPQPQAPVQPPNSH